MRSATAQYALRALTHLAGCDPGRPVLARDLARAIEVPPHYLAKVLGSLARRGILKATRGAGGGYRLAKAPAEISLAEVVAPFEQRTVLGNCFLDEGSDCALSAGCAAHARWLEVMAVYNDFFAKTTLADVARSAERAA